MDKTNLSEKISNTLLDAVNSGLYPPNSRLPSERDLAKNLDVSRPLIREAIQSLRTKGILFTRRGGGTYVNENIDLDVLAPLSANLLKQDKMRMDILEVRHSLEESAAYYAALRATSEDHKKIKHCFNKINEAEDSDIFAISRADLNFHLSIVKASHNIVLLHIMTSLFDILLENIKSNLDLLYKEPKTIEPLNRQHKNLMNAIINGNAAQAKLAAKDHLVFVQETLNKPSLSKQENG